MLLHGLMMDASLWDRPIAAPAGPAAADRVRVTDPRPGDAATARWMRPGMRRPDPPRMLRAAAADTRLLLAAVEDLPSFDHPALVIWASGDRVMPPEHRHRLAELLPPRTAGRSGRQLHADPLDQPARLAQIIRELAHASGTAGLQQAAV